MADDLVIRAAAAADIAAVSRLDSRITGISQAKYWEDMFERYGKRTDRFFLIAEPPGGGVVGFIIGEVRAWEFGSPPSGWIFALGVDPRTRLKKIGSRLFEAICACLAESGVDTVRTCWPGTTSSTWPSFAVRACGAGRSSSSRSPLSEVVAAADVG